MKKMVRILSGSMVILMISSAVMAQTNDLSRLERLNSQKIAYFTQKLQLTPAEAEKFWPVYNQFQKEKNTLILEQRKSAQYFRQNIGIIEDDEIEELADEMVRSKAAEADLYRNYHDRFKEVLPIKKVMLLYQTENSYMAMLLQQLRNQRPATRKEPR